MTIRILTVCLLVGLSQPSFADDITYPVELKFQRVSAKEANELLKGVDVPEEIDTRANPNKGSKELYINTFIPEYRVAFYDLNDDGVEEIFLATSGRGICGQLCPYDIYAQTKNGSFQSILGTEQQGVGSLAMGKVSENAVNSYHDILIGGKNGYGVWSFDGEKYKFNKKYKN